MDKLAELKPRVRLYGDTGAAQNYIGAAKNLLFQTIAVAQSAGVPIYALNKTLPDGTVIRAEVFNGMTSVAIATADYIKEEGEREHKPEAGDCLLITQLGAYEVGSGYAVCSSFAVDTKTLQPFYYDWRYLDDDIKVQVPFVSLQNVVASDSELIGIPTGMAASFNPYPDMPDSNGNVFIETIAAPDLFTINMQAERPNWRLESRGLLDKPAGIAVYRWETLRILHDDKGNPTSNAVIAASSTIASDRERRARRIDRLCRISLTDMRVIEVRPISPRYVLRTSNEHGNHLVFLATNYGPDFSYSGDASLVLIDTRTLEQVDVIATPMNVNQASPLDAIALDRHGLSMILEPYDYESDVLEVRYSSVMVDFNQGLFGPVAVGPISSNAADLLDVGGLYPGRVLPSLSVYDFNSVEIAAVDGDLFCSRGYSQLGEFTLRPNLKVYSQGYWNTAFAIYRMDRETGQITNQTLFDCFYPQQPAGLAWKRIFAVGEQGKTHKMIRVKKSLLPPFNLLRPEE